MYIPNYTSHLNDQVLEKCAHFIPADQSLSKLIFDSTIFISK
jgi:hypothetical protein